MFSGKSTTILGLIFAILLIIVAAMYLFDSGKSERTFREELVSIDTANVTEIYLYPKSENYGEVKLFKSEEGWRVPLDENRVVSVPSDKIKSLFSQLLSIKPKRLAARGENKWGEFQVDSTGTRVKIMEGSKRTLDIILGRFSFQQQPRSMSTFVRLASDNDVYEVDGFLEPSFNQDANSFRDGTVLKDDFNNWESLTFNYPADSSFQLNKIDNGWQANGREVDSAETVKYLRQIAGLTNNNFIDNLNDDLFLNPLYSLSISSNEKGLIQIKAIEDTSGMVIKSSLNDEAYFDGTKNKLAEKIFIGMKSLLPK